MFYTWTRFYKEIFHVDLRHARIWAFWLADKSYVTIFSLSEAENSSIAQIYAEIFFIGLGPAHSKSIYPPRE